MSAKEEEAEFCLTVQQMIMIQENDLPDFQNDLKLNIIANVIHVLTDVAKKI